MYTNQQLTHYQQETSKLHQQYQTQTKPTTRNLNQPIQTQPLLSNLNNNRNPNSN